MQLFFLALECSSVSQEQTVHTEVEGGFSQWVLTVSSVHCAQGVCCVQRARGQKPGAHLKAAVATNLLQLCGFMQEVTYCTLNCTVFCTVCNKCIY